MPVTVGADWMEARLIPSRLYVPLLCAVLLTLSSHWAEAARRVALVIGNSAYEQVTELPNPKNDAADMAGKLRGLDFKVVSGIDLDLRGMRETVRDFIRELDGADLALFFYAGHGLQVDGVNYMVPVDAQLATYDELEFEAMKIDLVLSAMERNTSSNLIFLDACRNNPLARNLARSMGTRSAAVGRGLARIGSGVGSLVSFSTQPGNVALDGEGRNSPFTEALLRYLGTPGEDIMRSLIRVRRDVLKTTKGKQVPWDSSSLTGDIILKEGPSPSASRPAAQADERMLELELWRAVENSGDVALIGDFLEKFPDGLFAGIARRKLRELEDEPEEVASLPPASSSAPAGNTPGQTRKLERCEGCADDLTVVSWGGQYTHSQTKAYVEPYKRATGVRIESLDQSVSAVGKLREMKQSGNVSWDVVDVVGSDVLRLCDEGLVEKIDLDTELAWAPDGTRPSEDFGAMGISRCYAPQIAYSIMIGYGSGAVDANGNKPDELCDIFDTRRFPGGRSLPQTVPFAPLYWAMLCEGHAPQDIYRQLENDRGVRQALAKLDTIRDDIIWWRASAEAAASLASGEAAFAATYNGRLFAAMNSTKGGIEPLWDGQIIETDGWVIPAGLPAERLARAKHFIWFATDTQRLADQAAWIAYGPARRSSEALLPRHAETGVDMRPLVPTSAQNMRRATVLDQHWIAEHSDRLQKLFDAWRNR